MGWLDNLKSSQWWQDATERAVKTFLQAYLAFWMVAAQVAGDQSEMFDTLFTWDNVKAGIVGLVLSLGTSALSKARGDSSTASFRK